MYRIAMTSSCTWLAECLEHQRVFYNEAIQGPRGLTHKYNTGKRKMGIYFRLFLLTLCCLLLPFDNLESSKARSKAGTTSTKRANVVLSCPFS
jgi:hypothetical protein